VLDASVGRRCDRPVLVLPGYAGVGGDPSRERVFRRVTVRGLPGACGSFRDLLRDVCGMASCLICKQRGRNAGSHSCSDRRQAAARPFKRARVRQDRRSLLVRIRAGAGGDLVALGGLSQVSPPLVAEYGSAVADPLPKWSSTGEAGVRNERALIELARVEADRTHEQLTSGVRVLPE
jgi:hypothetical protein